MASTIYVAVFIVAVIMAVLAGMELYFWHKRKDLEPEIIVDKFYKFSFKKSEVMLYVSLAFVLVFGFGLPFLKNLNMWVTLLMFIGASAIGVAAYIFLPTIISSANDHKYFSVPGPDNEPELLKQDVVLVKGIGDKFPALSVYADKDSNPYLCACVQVGRTSRWLISPTTYETMNGLLTNAITIRDAICSCPHLWLVVESGQRDTAEYATPASIPDSLLPEDGATMMAEDDEFYQVLTQLYDKYVDEHDEISHRKHREMVYQGRRESILKKQSSD